MWARLTFASEFCRLPGISRSEGRGKGLCYKLCSLRALVSSIFHLKSSTKFISQISEPQSTALFITALFWCTCAWSSEQAHIFWHLVMSFLDIYCSQLFQKKDMVFVIFGNALIQEVDAQNFFSVPEHCHCHNHLAG